MAILFAKHKENFISLLMLKIDLGVKLTLYSERRNMAVPYAKLTPDTKSNGGEPG